MSRTETIAARAQQTRHPVLPRHPRSLIATNDSPDVGFDASINPYRGCEHGCIYCYARPYSRVPRLLRRARLRDQDPREGGRARAAAQGAAVAAAGSRRRSASAASPMPISRSSAGCELTRRCLEVLAEFRNPVGIITKNHLVTRDIDHARASWPGITRGGRLHQHHDARRDAGRRDGAARTSPRGPARPRSRELTRGRHPGGRDGRAGHPRPDRPRDAGDPRGRGRRRRASTPATSLLRLPYGRGRPVRRLAGPALSRPQGRRSSAASAPCAAASSTTPASAPA